MDSLCFAGVGEREIFALISLHNKLRGCVNPPAANMRRMVSGVGGPEVDCSCSVTLHIPGMWSEDLRSQAQTVASQCRFAPPDDGQVGWNLQSFPAKTISLLDLIHLWYRQGEDFDFERAQCAPNRTCRHYTQMVWATSWELGCAISRCHLEEGDTDMMVCAYSPGGNWDIGGEIISPYQSGSWCSFCTATWSGCFKTWEQRGGLCEVPRNPCRISCRNYGRLNTTNCQCHCAPGYTGRYCQVRCGSRCVHGRFREDECSCVCRAGYGGEECTGNTIAPNYMSLSVITEKLQSSAPSCDILSDELCFTISSHLHSYYGAKKDCQYGLCVLSHVLQRSGGFLAQITAQRIQDILAFFLARLQNTNDETDRDPQKWKFWIGLTYKPGFTSYRWDSGEPLVFQSFSMGQPDNPGTGNCVEMRASSGFNWNDQQCKIQNRYICQHKI
ncbi:C-type lectin domain family 18 member C [Rana temporaria]|uniref:C-type lectin domain family 18 member C n=1 Tax=Rana temporaria TaxID=8407 RepID=UPI001AAD08AF|nr:C-type lectin domain family 18 member C [Rana temporaria]